jgi:hypothetical protein
MTHIALPLFGFNVGIELGQLVVLSAAALLLSLVDLAIDRLMRRRSSWAPLEVRIAAVSTIIVLVASRWAFERRPW